MIFTRFDEFLNPVILICDDRYIDLTVLLPTTCVVFILKIILISYKE